MKKLLVLGRGYVGCALESFEQNIYDIQAASRSDGASFVFDLMQKETWENLPSVDATIWTFPAVPLAQVQDFYKALSEKLGRIVIIGTTGSFEVEYSGQVVNEESPINSDQPRVIGENYLLEQGATVVHSAGIYGEGRDPRDWVMRGLVGPEDRYVNFIHVDDLCQFLLAATEPEHAGKRYVASDSNPQKWSELIESWKELYNLVLPSQFKSSTRASKRVDSTKSIESLGVKIKYTSVFEGLWPIGS